MIYYRMTKWNNVVEYALPMEIIESKEEDLITTVNEEGREINEIRKVNVTYK